MVEQWAIIRLADIEDSLQEIEYAEVYHNRAGKQVYVPSVDAVFNYADGATLGFKSPNYVETIKGREVLIPKESLVDALISLSEEKTGKIKALSIDLGVINRFISKQQSNG